MLKQTDQRNLWQQTAYVQIRQEVEPFRDLHLFRPLDQAYTGNNGFWAVPSPEPDLNDEFHRLVKSHLDDEYLKTAACQLAADISDWEPDGERLIFAAILRAGVPIADWLTRLIPGSAAVSLSLFVGLGIDQPALNQIKKDYPDGKLVFVDGWTGRGGVSRAIKELKAGPLAVLIDPWGWADFAGCREDIFCPTACFTGLSTLGFSRTFFIDKQSLFSAYGFPDKYCRPDLVHTWQALCPSAFSNVGHIGKGERFFKETGLRIHTNEVCRALINASPKNLIFRDDAACVQTRFSLLQALAERRKVPIIYGASWLTDLKTRAACELNIRS